MARTFGGWIGRRRGRALEAQADHVFGGRPRGRVHCGPQGIDQLQDGGWIEGARRACRSQDQGAELQLPPHVQVHAVCVIGAHAEAREQAAMKGCDRPGQLQERGRPNAFDCRTGGRTDGVVVAAGSELEVVHFRRPPRGAIVEASTQDRPDRTVRGQGASQHQPLHLALIGVGTVLAHVEQNYGVAVADLTGPKMPTDGAGALLGAAR